MEPKKRAKRLIYEVIMKITPFEKALEEVELYDDIGLRVYFVEKIRGLIKKYKIKYGKDYNGPEIE